MKKNPLPAHNTPPTPSNRELSEIFEGGSNPGGDPFFEILNIFTSITPVTDIRFLTRVHNDVTLIFQGRFEKFRASEGKYHDLRHTRNVVLATIRLLHGLHLQGTRLSPEMMEFCLVSAYFHDMGMLLTTEDNDMAGSAYLCHHEERSIRYLTAYLNQHTHLGRYSEGCAPVINCTNLTIAPETLTFASPELRLAGHILGSADILAQMADRYYLESLPHLYQEQLDAGIELHGSFLEMMRQTTRFYHEVIENRLCHSFANICQAIKTHFRLWWGVDRNLYLEFIDQNIKHLEDVVRKHDSGEGGIYNYLRRKLPTSHSF